MKTISSSQNDADRRLRRSRMIAAVRAFVPRRALPLLRNSTLRVGALPLLLLGLPALADDLKVTVEGVRSNEGSIMIGLYDSAEGFNVAIKHSTEAGLLNDKGRLVGAALRAVVGAQSTIFTQLRPGRYAVIVFHDENDNGRLDESSWGVPTEGYGFSNDAQGLLAAPSFDAAAVTLDGADKDIAISLIYPRKTVRAPSPAKELE
jgi:uncharacterized protein (DUF2141 family)